MRIKFVSLKVVAPAILLALLISCAPNFSLKTAHAQEATDPADMLSVGVKSFTEAADKFAHTGISAFGMPVPFTSMDYWMKLAVKEVIHKLQDQVVGWVTGGGEGGQPLFETDLNQYLNNVHDLAGASYLNKLSGNSGQLCGYFKNDIILSLSSYFNLPTNVSGSVNSACKLERQIGMNRVQAFTSGDFQGGGGWDTWNQITQNDDGNRLGAFLTTRDNIHAAINSQESINREELDWGNGVHSIEGADGKITTPGSLISDQLNQVLSSDLRQLELSDNFDDVVTALASSLITKMMTDDGGLTGTAAKSKSSQSKAITVRPKFPTQSSGSSSSSGNTAASQPQNIAVSGTANQSSTLVDGDGNSHDASIALTGYKNRNPKFGGVSITKSESNPFWQVDLGKTAPIDHIDITPRIADGFGDDLTGFYVIISDSPIVGNAIPVDGNGVWVSSRISPANPREDTTTVTPPSGTLGRYVRIQEDHTARLEIAGVQVFALSVPIVNVIGDNPYYVNLGDTFTDPGAIAIDQTQGDISANIGVSGSVNTSVAGTYTLRYSVTNAQGVSSGVAKRTVIVK